MDTPETSYDLKSAAKVFSRIGFALIAFYLATLLSQTALVAVIYAVAPTMEMPTLLWVLVSTGTMYLFGFPAFCFIVSPLKKDAPAKNKCPASTFFVSAIIMIALMYIGQNIGSFAYLALSDWLKLDMASETLMLVSDMKWYEAFPFVVIIGPFFEELIFRKLILDRTKAYGEKFAIIFSALLFGLFHMSIEQFFYAFLIGLLIGYFYIRKGNFLLCWLLHAIFNLIGGVLPLIISSLVDLEQFAGLMLEENLEEMIKLIEENFFGYSIVSAYSLSMLCLSFVGYILIIIKAKKMYFNKTSLELPHDSEATVGFLNPGVILFTLFAIVYPLISAAFV